MALDIDPVLLSGDDEAIHGLASDTELQVRPTLGHVIPSVDEPRNMVMEEQRRSPSIESARNAAIAWLEQQGVRFGPHRKVEIGRLGLLAGHEVGVSATEKPYWRLRLDYDPVKGPHFNAEFGDGPTRKKCAFTFPGTEDLIRKLALSRRPR